MGQILTPIPVKPTQTQAQITASVILAAQTALQTNYVATVSLVTLLYSLVWTNPRGFTPQQVMNALGVNAGELMRLLTLWQSTANSALAGSVPTTFPFAYTTNADGTVTIGAKLP